MKTRPAQWGDPNRPERLKQLEAERAKRKAETATKTSTKT